MQIPKAISLIIRRLILLMGIYTVLRLLFLLWNWPYFADETLAGILKAFIHGLRFDLSALFTINALFILLAVFLPQKWTISWLYRKTVGALFYLINLIFIGANVVDLEFYQFLGRRLSIDVFAISDDIQNQTSTIIFYYWYLTLLFLFIAYLYWKLSPRLNTKSIAPLFGKALWGFVFLVSAVIGARGGLQLKPIMPVDAFIGGSVDLGALSLNSTFTLTRSEMNDTITVPEHFQTNKSLLETLPYKGHAQPTGMLKDYNLVFIVMESFSLEFMGLPNGYEGYTPFLDSLAREGYFFTNAFANGRRSIEALPSLLCSLPALMDQPLITSNYQGNRYTCLGETLKGKGYTTAFFHGAHTGSMSFDSFSKRAGFEEYFGMEDYPGPGDRDGYWGIYDAPFFEFAAEKMSDFQKPFGAVLFSLSSHHPYSIPKDLQGKFPKGTLEIHESIGYSDYALKEFFEAIKTKEWFRNTLFVITADHTSLTDHPNYQDELGRYRVPLIFWTADPNSFNRQIDEEISQHIDIYPTILDLLGVPFPKEHHRWGRALFQEEDSTPPMAFNKLSGGYWLLKDEGFILTDKYTQLLKSKITSPVGSPDASTVTDLPNNDTAVAPPLPLDKVNALTKELQSILQYYFSGVVYNSWPEDETSTLEN